VPAVDQYLLPAPRAQQQTSRTPPLLLSIDGTAGRYIDVAARVTPAAYAEM